jgi:hypothetical protein
MLLFSFIADSFIDVLEILQCSRDPPVRQLEPHLCPQLVLLTWTPCVDNPAEVARRRLSSLVLTMQAAIAFGGFRRENTVLAASITTSSPKHSRNREELEGQMVLTLSRDDEVP